MLATVGWTPERSRHQADHDSPTSVRSRPDTQRAVLRTRRHTPPPVSTLLLRPHQGRTRFDVNRNAINRHWGTAVHNVQEAARQARPASRVRRVPWQCVPQTAPKRSRRHGAPNGTQAISSSSTVDAADTAISGRQGDRSQRGHAGMRSAVGSGDSDRWKR